MKKNYIITAFSVLIGLSINAQTYTISTIAGNGTIGDSGNGGPATLAEFYHPCGVTVDPAGNLYIACKGNGKIKKVDTNGIISNIAGGGSSLGDGGAATAAELSYPVGVFLDATGNVYIAESGDHRIRKINTSGIISTIAGTGVSDYFGDGGAATSAKLEKPSAAIADAAGNVYIADMYNHRIRKINTNGIISTIAGNGTGGYSGDGGPATAAELFYPTEITFDALGNLYIADEGNDRIRKINTNGIISTIAGNGNSGSYGDGGAATSAALHNPTGIALDAAGNVYIADNLNNKIRKVNTNGIISTIAGSGTGGYLGDGGAATAAELNSPVGIAIDASGNLYVSDYNNQRIRKLTISTTGIEQLNETNNQLTVYPNPNNGVFTVQSVSEGVYSIINALGQTIQSVKLNSSNNYTMNIENLSRGVYFIVGYNNKQMMKQKVVVTK